MGIQIGVRMTVSSNGGSDYNWPEGVAVGAINSVMKWVCAIVKGGSGGRGNWGGDDYK